MFELGATGGCSISKETAQLSSGGKFKHLKYSVNVKSEGANSAVSIVATFLKYFCLQMEDEAYNLIRKPVYYTINYL